MSRNDNRLIRTTDEGIRDIISTPVGEISLTELHFILHTREHYRNIMLQDSQYTEEDVMAMTEHIMDCRQQMQEKVGGVEPKKKKITKKTTGGRKRTTK